MKRLVATLMTAGLMACAPDVIPPPKPDPKPDPKPITLNYPATCTEIPVSSANPYAQELGVAQEQIENFWRNEDSAYKTTGELCLTNFEKEWLDLLITAKQGDLLSEQTLEAILERYYTTGPLAIETLKLGIQEAQEEGNEIVLPLPFINMGTVQPTAQLPGVRSPKDNEGNYLSKYPINEQVSKWIGPTWNLSNPKTFINTYVEGLPEICRDFPDQEIANSIDVLFVPSLTILDTTVYNGSLLPARLVNVAEGQTFPGIDFRVYLAMAVPYDDETKPGKINVIRGEELLFGYVHIGELNPRITKENIGNIMIAPGEHLGRSARVFDFNVSVRASTLGKHPDLPKIPENYPRMQGTTDGIQGRYSLDFIPAAFPKEATEAGIPPDFLHRVLGGRYRDPITLFDDICLPEKYRQ